MPLPAAAYARYSSDMQEDMSIASQISECKAWAEKNGYEIVAVYTDEATSGTIARDGLDELKTAVASRECPFEAVIAWKASRIARDVEIATGFRGYLRRHNIKLLFAADVNIEGPMAVIIDSILDGFNAYFIEDLAANVLRGQKQWVSQGYAPPGFPPYGYVKVPVDSSSSRQKYKYAPHPEQAALVRRIFQEYADGIPLTEIARRFEAEGIRTQNGARWTCGKMWAMMFKPTREVYLGTIIFNRMGRKKPEPGDKRPRKNQKKFEKPESEWIRVENAHEPILTRELLDQVDAMRTKTTARMEFHSRVRNAQPQLLSGLIRCKKCGSLYGIGYGGSGVPRKKYYRCHMASALWRGNAKRNERCPSYWLWMSEVDESLLALLKKHIGELKGRDRKVDVVIPPRKKEIEYYERQRLEIVRKRNNLIDVIADGTLPKDAVANKLNELAAALETIDASVRKIKREIADEARVQSTLAVIENIKDGWEKDRESARRVILETVAQLIADDLTVTVYYKLPIEPDSFTLPLRRRRLKQNDG